MLCLVRCFISVSNFSLIGPFIGLMCFLQPLEHKPSSVIKLILDVNVTFNIYNQLYCDKKTLTIKFSQIIVDKSLTFTGSKCDTRRSESLLRETSTTPLFTVSKKTSFYPSLIA